MEGTVMSRSRSRILPRVLPSGNDRKREPGIYRPECESIPVELRRQQLTGGCGLDGLRGGRRRGHTGLRAKRKSGMAGQDQQQREARTSGERPPESDPPTHQDEVNRILRRGDPGRSRGSNLLISSFALLYMAPIQFRQE